MNYRETLDFLFNSLPAYQRVGEAAYKSDLKTTLALDNYFGAPHKHYKTIHIAGTNGKGSVAGSLSSILTEAGYRTGLYTSPHLLDFRERIRINGEKIEKEYVVEFVGKHKGIIDELKPSFFEMTAAMAFQYFADSKVDIAVVETGMGGRLDSTNIISPIISVITNISKDHTQFLGDTIEEIAGEKAGIIKQDTSVVIGRSCGAYDHVFESVARSKNSPLLKADRRYSFKPSAIHSADHNLIVDVYKDDSLRFSALEVNLGGSYQLENILTTVAVSDLLKDKLTIEDISIRRGLQNIVSNTGIKGRWQIISDRPMIICDTAHNIDGISVVLEQLLSLKESGVKFILGFVSDKDIDHILRLFPADGSYYFTRSSVPRSLDHKVLGKKALAVGLKGEVFNSVADAYSTALREIKDDDVLFVGGSTFIVADLLVYLNEPS